MSHFAKVENNLVPQVIVAEPDFIATGALGDPAAWVQTSYNTIANTHLNGGEPLHKNYAGIGYTWDGTGFAAPSPFPSWTLNPESYIWEAPTPKPEGLYDWDESTLSWKEAVIA